MDWINVKIKEPEIDEIVIFFAPNNEGCSICIGYIFPKKYRGHDLEGNEYYWFVEMSENAAFTKDEVTHWGYLPEYPKD